MSKVICDVCGTTYPDTASACPICGSARNTTAQTGANASDDEEKIAYTYVKGGRFSKKNVRKRNSEGQRRAPSRQPEEDDEEETEGNNKILIFVVVMLVLAILSVLGYIAVRYFWPGSGTPQPTNPISTQATSQTTPQTDSTEPSESTPAGIPCTGLVLDNQELKFTDANSVWLLGATVEPKDTTDALTFASSDESVAIVSGSGSVTPVGYGECVIIVKCGNQEAQCKVTCTFGTPPETEPSVPVVTTPADFTLKLNRKDFTLSKEGDKWALFKETDGIKPSDITWTTSDEKVATVKDGVVQGVDYGDCTITATLGDQSASCIVRIRFHAATTTETNPNTVKINKTDVTIDIGETFNLILTDSQGAKINVEWTVNAEGYVTIDGSKITGKAATVGTDQKFVVVSAEYEGTTYSCTVRVAPPKETT